MRGFLLCLCAPVLARATDLTLAVDARDILARRQHVHVSMPVAGGPLTLVYPKWVPGEHRPNGPITQLVALTMRADGRPVAWRRDAEDAFAFHVDVPPGASRIDVDFDYLSPSASFGTGFGKAPNVTPHVAVLLFGQLVLYPAGVSADDVRVRASVRLPDAWRADGALVHDATGDVALPDVSLAELVDAPLLAGDITRSVDVPGDAMRARLRVATDAPADLATDAALMAVLGRVIDETVAVAGPPARPDYVWLLALSDLLTHDGTEHRESSDVREGRGFLRDGERRYRWTVLPHELFHAWNGKYRRPHGLATANFQQPMRDDLLWVYEGLTRYYGDVVIPARSGLSSTAQTRDYLAYVAAQAAYARPGRAWRSLADTAIAIPAFADAPFEGTASRRGADYYNEAMLVWLEADMRIRTATAGRRSLDDMCRRFFAGGPERVRPYGREDVVAALRDVAGDVDWDAFLDARIDRAGARAPLGGLEASGWSVVYDDRTNPFIDRVERDNDSYSFATSLGLWVAGDGTVQDVAPGSVADRASIASGWRVMAVNGDPWSVATLAHALVGARATRAPVALRLAYGDAVRDVALEGRVGLRIPHLARRASMPDTLDRILAPRRPPPRERHEHLQQGKTS